MQKKHNRRFGLVGLAIVLCLGCGPPHGSTVTGVVTLDGEPLKHGTVTFHPVERGASAYGQIGSEGGYEIRTGASEGLKPGKYKATVVATEPTPPDYPKDKTPPMGRLITPQKYGTTATTDLEYEVSAGANEIAVALTSKT